MQRWLLLVLLWVLLVLLRVLFEKHLGLCADIAVNGLLINGTLMSKMGVKKGMTSVFILVGKEMEDSI